jgi:hypothetical protein
MLTEWARPNFWTMGGLVLIGSQQPLQTAITDSWPMTATSFRVRK